MNAIQLDECISSKKLVKICTQEVKISTVPFPSAIGGKGIKDPEVLQWWNTLGTTGLPHS